MLLGGQSLDDARDWQERWESEREASIDVDGARFVVARAEAS